MLTKNAFISIKRWVFAHLSLIPRRMGRPLYLAAALDRLEASRAAAKTHDQAIWAPALSGKKVSGQLVPSEINTEMERLQGLRFDAEEKLVMTPTPHMQAVIAKIELSRKTGEDFSDRPDIGQSS